MSFAPSGYPDMGSGLYAKEMTYAEWLRFNNAQRAHHNTLESLTFVLPTMLAAGVLHPKTAAALGLTYAAGRALYAIGYNRGGPSGRMLGGLISHIGDMGLIGVCIRGGLKVAGAF